MNQDESKWMSIYAIVPESVGRAMLRHLKELGYSEKDWCEYGKAGANDKISYGPDCNPGEQWWT